jgi:hypothetical protein
MSPDTITTAQVVAVFHALSTATEKARRVMRLAEDSDITPQCASERLNAILSNLDAELEQEGASGPDLISELTTIRDQGGFRDLRHIQSVDALIARATAAQP